MKTMLSAHSLSLGYGDKLIIKELDLEISKGEITVFIGANGCGKSTLLRSAARLLKAKAGAVMLEGNDIAKMSTKEVAKKMAILPQSPIAPEGLTVYQLVKQGRYPHHSWLKKWSKTDELKVQGAIKATKLEELSDQPVDELSGGQRQRAWIAMTLAQDTDTILLDEPTTYLDMAHQIEILDLLFELNEKEKRTIIMVLHDLNLACRYAHNLVAIKDGTVYVQGKPEQVVTCETVRHVFNMECHISTDPMFGTPFCVPYGRGRCLFKDKEAVSGA
ncbi:cobalamin/Fe(3+)-siderophore ABC transporter ATP-binding protein [Pueribacillus theae]|uniref:Cobalamin/Fe(3+)-siderophore ABC transporter ATP-binding protein n=1 Tax=Pueribacillus theae TaxID=2171751 RepID=A0A2U1K3C7_9BACI|nr:ABC transporter ATP-binding protein [Pueribacillus theae]PWA12037.1 cobalamin/Fe(3+)-siderophore ABC transporter ATP-binding protein [Pueribacillus theae]